MSYSIQYTYSFKTLQGDDCRVDILKDDALPATVKRTLDPGPDAFVLREFNTSSDLFKHTRGFIAELQILATNGVKMDDFIGDADDSFVVYFYFNGQLFWRGWLMQDDFQEPWIDSAHYITLRATDGLGTLSGEIALPATGQVAVGTAINLCLADTPVGSGIPQNTIICNLFYDGMLDRSDGPNSALFQATVDVRTFAGDNKVKILEKVMKAWSLVIFQYEHHWWIIRIEEFLNNTALHGVTFFPLLIGEDVAFTKSFDVPVGVGEDIKPIAPEMLRSIRRPSKETKVSFFYRFPSEIFPNQSFQQGDTIIPTTDTYEVDYWEFGKVPNLAVPGAPVADFYRKEVRDVDGNLTDNYIFIEGDADAHFAKSSGLAMNTNDRLDFSVDYRTQRNPISGSVNVAIAYIIFQSGSNYYIMNDDGNWISTNSTYTSPSRNVSAIYAPGESTADWKNISVRSKGVPANGTLWICLANTNGTTRDANFKGLTIGVIESSKQNGVIGDFDRYTIPGRINQLFDEETFLDDSNNRQHKGALHFNDALTGDNWYRMAYPSERLTFKRHKAIAHMMQNWRRREKLEVTMLGLTWVDGTTEKPIWLQNKFIFVDDAPGKKFMLANLSEMNFSAGIWKGSLMEIWDDVLDADLVDPADYPAHDFANIYEKDV